MFDDTQERYKTTSQANIALMREPNITALKDRHYRRAMRNIPTGIDLDNAIMDHQVLTRRDKMEHRSINQNRTVWKDV